MSTYTGDVVPGGPPDVRQLPGLVVRKISVEDTDNNCYLLTCSATGRQALVDAAGDAPRLLDLVRSTGDALDVVVTTHQHWDHHRALADVVAATGARTAAGADDADALPVPVQQRLAHGDRVEFGRVALDVVHLRGHTPGSVALVARAGGTHLFTGDSLFPGGVGRTTSPQDFASLLQDVQERLFGCYDDAAWVYPGHGRDTTLGAERPSLPEWRARGW
ncbi:MBL fold metallo-hydrolase [Quadrisphaera sp. DSM 44207]|uniref:MBL fold metallo-hydrolase n=1 Tax=Quadrisphaera sp. DSM 44207 TaxID=1881057 RepID=UPI000884B18C|nr:MBL fold metallo-hydrolase [Quadrisphaera sp. DSM 44207]SDQ44778.1 Glyoxylase, beta-lactamase superfamily II [Quadrisphaera sp. DSM 44207]